MNSPHTHPWLHKKLCTEGYHFIRRSDKFWAGLWPDLVIEQVLMRSIKNCGGLTRGRVMTALSCLLWIRSMHICGSINEAMASVTDHLHTTSEQHQELGHSRIKRDYEDLQKVIEWFKERNPFDSERKELQSLSSGVTADDTVNCDETEKVGQQIHDVLDKKSVQKCTIKRALQLNTLGSMKNIIKINKQDVSIDPTKLFSRLVVHIDKMTSNNTLPMNLHQFLHHFFMKIL